MLVSPGLWLVPWSRRTV